MGGKPLQSGRRLSSFFSSVFTACCLPGSDSRSGGGAGEEGGERRGGDPFGRQDLSGTFAARGVKSVY